MERLEIIEALKHTPDAVAAETAGLSESVLRYRPSEDAWSIKETIGHMRDLAEIWHKRIYSVWSLTDPRFASLDARGSVKEHAYFEADVPSLIAEMREWRLKTVDVLVHAVDWTRLGQHPELGRRSLKQWGEYLVGQEAKHLAAIRALKEAQATRQPG